MWLSLISLLIPLSGGFYFLYRWQATKRTQSFLLFFGLGLLFIQLFKLPNILINYGIMIPTSILNPYFFSTLLLYLLSYFCIINGFFHLARFQLKTVNLIFLILTLLAFVYFLIIFFVSKFYLSSLVWPGHVFFFIPAQLLTLFVYSRTITILSRKVKVRLPKILMFLSLYLFFSTSIAYIYAQTGSSADNFWYLFVTLSWGISVLQIFATLLLFSGLYFLTKNETYRNAP